MKKVAGIVFAMVMMGTLLAGCYSKSCDQPQPAPVSYKGENR
jgi:outer membrane murein-binding lipoprotein Lpp